MNNFICHKNGIIETTIAPVHAEDIEKTVLGSCLVSEKALHAASKLLIPDYFYNSNHAKIFEKILEIYHINRAVDIVIIGEQLPGNELLLSELVEIVNTCENVNSYIGILIEKYRQRKLINLAKRIQNNIENGSIAVCQEVAQEIENLPKYGNECEQNVYSPNWDNEPEKTESLIELDGIKILSCGNLCMITAGAGDGNKKKFCWIS